MANFPGTNIPLSSFKGSDARKRSLIRRLEKDISNEDIDGLNDNIFSIAFYSQRDPDTGEWGRGAGNALVSKVHSGQWKADVDFGDEQSWAESNINSANDVYKQLDAAGDVTSTISWDDNLGVLKDGDSIGSWGGQDKTEQGEGATKRGVEHPPVGVKGEAPINPVISGGGGLSRENVGLLSDIWSGFSLDNSDKGLVSASPIEYAAYRPGSRKYWSEYMGPKLTESLMEMRPQASFSPYQTQLAYLPGEQRDPNAWEQFLGMGGLGTKERKFDNQFQGSIPQGLWIDSPKRFRDLTKTRTVGGRQISQTPGAPWNFTTTAAPSYRMPGWAPHDITAPALAEWKGLLSDWTAPELNTTNLLGAA